MRQSVLVYSGGLDSTVLLYWLIANGYKVSCLGFDYGQRHRKELSHAAEICSNLEVEFKEVNLSNLQPLLDASSQTSSAISVPEGHYTDDNMKLTVVPNRNMIILSIGIGWAVNIKAQTVAYAAHAGDHTIYPDCRPEFVEVMQQAAILCDWHKVELQTPFLHFNKAEIVRVGHELKVPFAQTWSCYKGEVLHCGKCGTCTERREAFQISEIKDPTEYTK